MTIKRPIKRETAAYERGKPLMIELHPAYMIIRQKGSREKFSIDYGRIFWSAVKIDYDRQRAQKSKKQSRR